MQHKHRQKSVSSFSKCTLPNKKVRFRDKKEALHYLHRFENIKARDLAEVGTSKRNEERVYFCAACKGFHATSKPLKKVGN